MSISATAISPAAPRVRDLPTLIQHNGAMHLVLPRPASQAPWTDNYTAVIIEGAHIGKLVEVTSAQLAATRDFVGTFRIECE